MIIWSNKSLSAIKKRLGSSRDMSLEEHIYHVIMALRMVRRQLSSERNYRLYGQLRLHRISIMEDRGTKL